VGVRDHVPAPLGLAGTTIAGGSQSRERLARVLGVAALARQGAAVAAVGWVVDHVEVEVAQPGGAAALFVLERQAEARPALLRCGEIAVGYRGRELHPAVEAALRRVAPRALAGVRLEDLGRVILADPESGAAGQPLPAAPAGDQRRFEDQSLLSTWGGAGVWRQFFAVAETARSQLDSLDTFNRAFFVQHCEAECLAIAPEYGVPLMKLAHYPWDDRVRAVDWRGAAARRAPEPFRLMTTDLNERDVILGRGAAKLDAAFAQLRERDLSASSMIFCSSTCLPVVAGEDVEAVVRRHGPLLPLPILHLTTTPHSMQTLLAELLVTRRREAEVAIATASPGAVNLVGFQEGPALEELRAALAALGVEVNVVLVPALGAELIDAFPRAALAVLSPNELWKGHYGQLLSGSRLRAISPPAPYGPSATAAWLRTVAGELGRDAGVDAAVEPMWAPCTDAWESLARRARRHRLGFVAAVDELDFLTDPRKTWGVPLLALAREMGFELAVLLHAGDRARPAELEAAVAALRSAAGGDVAITPVADRHELGRALAGAGLSAVFSEHVYDRRLTESRLSSFSLQHFEQGFGGAVRTLRRLVELCELPFYRRYGRHLALAAARRPGVADALGRGGP
jgi:hypothetical protein